MLVTFEVVFLVQLVTLLILYPVNCVAIATKIWNKWCRLGLANLWNVDNNAMNDLTIKKSVERTNSKLCYPVDQLVQKRDRWGCNFEKVD